ncbi:ABC transporter permease [Rhizohabitans arisaemae]|uniref:ABC transporter permease n=1 Tax=Rhizohabitans arisaemae TaxID=2720610 RepID=UPI0024B0FECD|nr:ABC transporter permease [Rhizohabitans arisaemae]
MSALAFTLRRLGAMVLLLLVLSFLCFALLGLSPGSPEQLLLGTRPATPELLATLRAENHLDEPFLMRYWYWIEGVLHLDLGKSVQTQQNVLDMIVERLPITATLALYSTLIALVVAIPAGLISGSRRSGGTDRAVTFAALVSISAPPFALGLLLLYGFAVLLGWFPVYGAGETFIEMVYHLTLPSLTLAAGSAAVIVRQLRATVIDVIGKDFMTFARARGLSPIRIQVVYLLRNSSLPMLTMSGLLLSGSLAGAVVVEQAFGLAGVGNLLVKAVGQLDIPVVQALALLTGAAVILINLLVDLAYLAIDPRLRHPRSAT